MDCRQLEGSTSSETFAQHLNALHAARMAYIESETSERIRRALRHKVRAAEEICENGDVVYYKRESKERWLGPATVVFQDGIVVFVRHGGIFVRMSPNRLRHTTRHTDENEREDKEKTENRLDAIKETAAEEMPVSEVVPALKEGTENRGNDNESEINHGENTEIVDQRGTNSDTEMREYRGSDTEAVGQTEKTSNVEKNDAIRYKVDGQWVTGTILSRAGKASGNTNLGIMSEMRTMRKEVLISIDWNGRK